MPVQSGKNSLFAKALKAHAKDQTDYGQEYINLPAGITGGLAQLVEAKRGKYAKGPNQGKEFLYLAGVVVEPKTATEVKKIWDADLNNKKGGIRALPPKEVKIEGQRTSVMIPLCDTKGGDGKGGTKVVSADENIAKALNELRKLGGEDCTKNISSEEDFDALLAALKEAGPVFRFSTSEKAPTAQYPNSGVWENWYGTKGVDYQAEPSANGHVEDSTGTEEETASDEVDLNELAAAADGGDEEAMAALKEKAEAVGVSGDDIDGADNWATVVEWIEAGGKPADEDAAEEEAAAEEPEETVPEKGNVYSYKPLDPKDKTKKKRLAKGVECECIAVNAAKKTCTLKNLDDGKTLYKDVPFAELIVE